MKVKRHLNPIIANILCILLGAFGAYGMLYLYILAVIQESERLW